MPGRGDGGQRPRSVKDDDPHRPPPSGAALAPFRTPDFRNLWLANLSSNFGGLVQGVGAAWLMTSLTSSASMVALVQASTTLPVVMLSLLSGAVADGFDRRRVMLAAQGFMLVVSILLAACAWLGWLDPWSLLAFTFLIGCGGALNNPSWQASVGDMVPRDDLPAAVTLNSVGFNLMRSVGPAAGGAIVAAGGAAAAFAVNAASYALLIGTLLRWRPGTSASPLPRTPLGSAITEGLRYVAMSPNIAKVMLRAFAFGLTSIAVLALLPLVARTLGSGSALTYGVLLGTFGAGAVAGAFGLAHLRERVSSEMLARGTFTGFALCATVLAAASSPWVAGPALMLGGACWVIALSTFNVTVQLSTPRWVLGRALSLYQMAAFGGMASGSWLWGHVAEGAGLGNALLWAALGMLAGALLGLRVPLPDRARLDLDPLNRWQRPHVELDLRPRSGPIAITVEYRISVADTDTFLDVMTERRRMRRRDGARRWALARDMEQPERWTESYQIPTWTEYLHYNERATREDASIGDRLRALHAGEGLPVVHRMIVRRAGPAQPDPVPRVPLDIH